MRSLDKLGLIPYGILITPLRSEVVKTRLYGILNQFLGEMWPKIWPLLEKAVDYSDGKYQLGDIFEAIKAREMQLWVVYEEETLKGVIITRIEVYPRKKSLFILFVGGFELDSWLHVTSDLEAFAKELDCVAIECCGRPGWKKAAAKVGFEQTCVVFRKSLV